MVLFVMLKIMMFVLMLGFVSAVDVELNCPDDVFVDEEFECELEVFDGDGDYDLKIEIDEERDSALKILDNDEWKSGYYYLKEYVRDEEVVKLKILESGRYDLIVKLRQGSERSEFDVGRVFVEDLIVEVSDETEEESDGVILLGGSVAAKVEPEWDYVSRDGKIADMLPYWFSLFLVFVIGVMMWAR